jgi:hypothetical protein
MTVPTLHRFVDGRLEATCGRCLAHSIAIVAGGDAEAWGVLEKLGWSVDSPEEGALSQPLCPACTTYPNAIE